MSVATLPQKPVPEATANQSPFSIPVHTVVM
ncbi:hypothetical protein EniLVp02_0173 [Vibrio phage EniLVp02]